VNASTDYNIEISVSFILNMRVHDPAHDDGQECNALHRHSITNPKHISKYTIHEICNRILRQFSP